MNAFSFALLAVIPALASASTARAELTWPAKSVELTADPGATALEARFPFSNDGPAPVDIRRVQTSCGCTTATVALTHYEPGQSGEIVAHYTVGDAVGVQQKSVYVVTGDGAAPTVLTLVVHLPAFVNLQPGFVTWIMGEPGTAKTIALEPADAGLPLRDVTLQASSTDIRAELQPSPDGGGKYQISLTPETTLRPAFTRLTIRCRVGEAEKTFHAYASVVAKRAPGPVPPVKPPPADATPGGVNP